MFVLEQNALSPNKELTTLRIILMHDKRYYIFLDFPKDHFLKETKLPLHKDKNGLWNLDEDEVKNILKKQFEKENVEVFSFLDHLKGEPGMSIKNILMRFLCFKRIV